MLSPVPSVAGAGTGTLAFGAQPSCQVLSGYAGFAVQFMLFTVCVGSLLLKWWLEEPRRKMQIFLLDSSKQFVGAGVIHMLNLACAVAFTRYERSAADECAWYWINIMIDTTFGVGICFVLLKGTERILGYDSGHYGKGSASGIDWQANPDFRKWLGQISVWCLIVSVMKLIVVSIMYLFAPMWERISVTCTNWISNNTMRLLFVMVLTPTCMNMFQFWVTDSFLKFSKKFKQDQLAEDLNETASLRSGPISAQLT